MRSGGLYDIVVCIWGGGGRWMEGRFVWDDFFYFFVSDIIKVFFFFFLELRNKGVFWDWPFLDSRIVLG